MRGWVWRLVLLLHHLLLLVGVHTFILVTHLGNSAHLLLLAAQLEVMVLGLLDLTVNSINFKFILLCLRLEMLNLSDHLLKLLRTLLQLQLILNQFLSDLRTTLLSQNVLQLDVELLLLLNEHIFLHHLLRFSNQSFLQRLDLLDQLVRVNIS